MSIKSLASLRRVIIAAKAQECLSEWDNGWNVALNYALGCVDELEQEQHHDFVRERIKELHGEIDTRLTDFMGDE